MPYHVDIPRLSMCQPSPCWLRQSSVVRASGLLALLIGLVTPSFTLAQPKAKEHQTLEVGRKTLNATKLVSNDGAMILDGRLSEVEWSRAQVGRDFVERVPNPRTRPPVKTRVRVVYGTEAIYVGVESEFLAGVYPRALELRRDSGRIWSDDTITLKIDVALDRRTTLFFGANSADAQVDGIALDNGRQFRREFDAVWSTASRVTNLKDGGYLWTLEYEIPYRALGLTSQSQDRIIGFNVTRDHNRRNATYDWTHLPPELGAMAASHFGNLLGVNPKGVRTLPYRIFPFALVQMPGQDQWSGDNIDIRAGGDVRLRLSKDLWSEFTILTDFAEVDLDDEIVNLSRFPLFLPEKRPFFLSGLNIFEFGARGRSQMFFSRRIGLDEDANPIPIWFGAKAYGQIGRLGVGALHVVSDPENDRPVGGSTILRTRYVSETGHAIGMMLTSENAATRPFDDDSQHSVGIDGALRLLDRRLEIGGFAALSIDQGAESNDENLGDTAQLYLDYRGRVWLPSLEVLRVSEHYDPVLGFVRRRDILNPSGRSRWIFRQTAGVLASTTVSVNSGVITTARADEYAGSNHGADLSFRFRNGWETGVGFDLEDDVVDSSFDLPTGQTIEAGTYLTTTESIYLESPYRRNPNFGLNMSATQGFYGGTAYGGQASLSAYITSLLRLSSRVNATWFKLPDETNWTQTMALNSGVTFAFSPRIFWENNIQFKSTDDNGRFLTRLRWRYVPGSDIFLVYQEDAKIGDTFEHVDRRVVFKLTYWFGG